jgi:hypothetical protein
MEARPRGKGVLKQAVRGIVPDRVIDRPKGYEIRSTLGSNVLWQLGLLELWLQSMDGARADLP